MITPSDIERTCREEGWILSSELLSAAYPVIVLAFMQYNEPAWEEFENDVEDENSDMTFFNTRFYEFESVTTWERLAENRGIVPSEAELVLPEDIPQIVKDALLEVRYFVGSLWERPASTGGCKAFYSPQEWRDRGWEVSEKVLCVVCHDGGDLAPLFNLDYQDYKSYDQLDMMLRRRGLYTETINSTTSHIYEIQN
jgi:hypothetical protein